MNDKFLRLKQVMQIIPISRSEIWRKVKNNKFPAPIKLSPSVTVWRHSDIQNFIEQHSAIIMEASLPETKTTNSASTGNQIKNNE